MVSKCQPGGEWDNDYIPDCVEAYCGPVPQIDNGFAVIATNVTWRGTASFQCYYGFAFPSGNQLESISCLQDGSWSPLPNCQGKYMIILSSKIGGVEYKYVQVLTPNSQGEASLVSPPILSGV